MTEGTNATASRILVVEDEPLINQAVTDRLRAEGFVVEQAHDGPGAVAALRAARHPDLVVLDLMLPGFDGLEVCRRIQAVRPVPVLMLTARDDETDLLVGLAVGADDYVTKPFSMREVVARVRALLRRVERAAALAGIRRRPHRRRRAEHRPRHPPGDRARRRGAPHAHSSSTCSAALAAEPGPVRSRDVLLREVWGWADASGTRTLDTHVKALRAQARRRPGPHRPRRGLRASRSAP